jgi:hypothetical protein
MVFFLVFCLDFYVLLSLLGLGKEVNNMNKLIGIGLGLAAVLGLASSAFAATYTMDAGVASASGDLVSSLVSNGLTMFGTLIGAVAVFVISIALAYWFIRHARAFLHI